MLIFSAVFVSPPRLLPPHTVTLTLGECHPGILPLLCCLQHPRQSPEGPKRYSHAPSPTPAPTPMHMPMPTQNPNPGLNRNPIQTLLLTLPLTPPLTPTLTGTFSKDAATGSEVTPDPSPNPNPDPNPRRTQLQGWKLPKLQPERNETPA